MKHIAGWFRRNNTIMAQAKDLQRQWQEMRDENKKLEKDVHSWWRSAQVYHSNYEYVKEMLHRVARERDQEREKRLAAEDALFDMHLDGVSIEPFAMTPKEVHDSYLEGADNEEE